MRKTYYLFNPGRLSRQDNTLKFVPTDEQGKEGPAKFLPVENVTDLYCFGSLDANSALYNFLGKNRISVHFFDYYEHYAGSFYPKEYLQAGRLQVAQSLHYAKPKKRLPIAQKLVAGAAFNMQKNLRYYQGRGRTLNAPMEAIGRHTQEIAGATEIPELMGLEGNIRQCYYSSFDEILQSELRLEYRSKQPPHNELNALISFGNMMCYTLCLGQIYHTQLNPTISFLHEPGERRFSLALDLAEIFKPILVDRTIFSLLNKRQLKASDFDRKLNGIRLKDSARKTFVAAWEERLQQTIKHRSLGRSVSYKHLVRLECYKLSKHILGIQPYEPFKAWW